MQYFITFLFVRITICNIFAVDKFFRTINKDCVYLGHNRTLDERLTLKLKNGAK